MGLSWRIGRWCQGASASVLLFPVPQTAFAGWRRLAAEVCLLRGAHAGDPGLWIGAWPLHVIAGDGLGPSPAATADPVVFADAALALVGRLIAKLQKLRRAAPDFRERRLPHLAAIQVEVAARLDLTHGRDEAEAGTAEAAAGHVLLANGAPGAVGPWPLVVPHTGGSPSLVVTAGFWGRFLGVLHVTFDAAGRVATYGGNPVLLDASVPEDPTVAAALARYAKPLEELRSSVLGQAETALDAAGCRREECQPGDLLAEAMPEIGPHILRGGLGGAAVGGQLLGLDAQHACGGPRLPDY